MSEFAHIVPKDIDANLRFRRDIIRQGAADRAFAAELIRMCARDISFFCCAFCWTYDPRLTGPNEVMEVPFITYDFQDKALLELQDILGKEDAGIEKSRDMGASWLCLLVMFHAWMFRRTQDFLLVSDVEQKVDSRNDPSSLFGKLDILLSTLPRWMQPAHLRQKFLLHNLFNDSKIFGVSSAGDASRGGRKTAILLDEFAAVDKAEDMLSATQYVTSSRIFNSTHKGSHTAFYRLIKSGMRVLRFHWSQHPVQRRGMYRANKHGRLEILNHEYDFPDDYKFILDGKLRSPYYDLQERRAGGNQAAIAEELDIDPHGAASQFFPPSVVEPAIANCRNPLHRGELAYDRDTYDGGEFVHVAGSNGRLSLWFNPNPKTGRPPIGMAPVFGVDIAQGTGSSNSVISIGDANTATKIGAFVSPNVRPEELARITAALVRWFPNEPLIVPEANGPGSAYIATLSEIGGMNIYMRRAELTINKKITKRPGWWSDPDAKQALFTAYRMALDDRTLTNPDADAIEELREIIFTQTRDIVHSQSLTKTDPSGAKANHGDRPTADALMWHGMRYINPHRETDPQESAKCPEGSFGWRRAQYEQEQRRKKDLSRW